MRTLTLKRKKTEEVDAQNAAEQFNVDFSILALELSELIKALDRTFGGEGPVKTTSDVLAAQVAEPA